VNGGCRLQASIVDTGWYNRLLPITSNMSSRADDEESSIILQNKMARAYGVLVHTHRIATPIPDSRTWNIAVRRNMMYVLLALSSKNYVLFHIARCIHTRRLATTDIRRRETRRFD